MSSKKSAVREGLKVSIMDKRREEERQEKKKLEAELAHPRWLDIWETEFPPRFDKQSVCPALQYLIDNNHILPGRALVPGCGRGYDVTALASANRYAVGVDISEDAIFSARERLRQVVELCEHWCVPCPALAVLSVCYSCCCPNPACARECAR